MNREDFEALGDIHKKYEARTETQLLPGCPVVVRLDGRSFIQQIHQGVESTIRCSYVTCYDRDYQVSCW